LSREILSRISSIYCDSADVEYRPASIREIAATIHGDFEILESLHPPSDEAKSEKILAEDELEIIEEGRNGKGLKK